MKYDFRDVVNAINKVHSSISQYDGEDPSQAECVIGMSTGDPSLGSIVEALTITVTTRRKKSDYKPEADVTRTVEIFSQAENKEPVFTTTTREIVPRTKK